MLSAVAPVSVLPSQPAQKVVDVTVASKEPAVEGRNESTSNRPDVQQTAPARRGETKTNDTEQALQMASVVQQLRQRDQQVRAHEMAHLAAAGAYATSAAQYAYQTGPDGRKYAVGGEVGIDLSSERDPADTIRKMQIVQRAALAPADPSPQDMRVAAMAAQQMMQAQQALQKQRAESTTQADKAAVALQNMEQGAEQSTEEDRQESGTLKNVSITVRRLGGCSAGLGNTASA